MLLKVLVTLIQLKLVLSDVSENKILDVYARDDRYRGEKFPQKYLSVDGVKPTSQDLSYYAETAFRIIDFFSETLNQTDPNVAIGSYLSKAIMKRTLLDYDNKIEDRIKERLKGFVRKAEDIVSHYTYDFRMYPPSDLSFQISATMRVDESLIHSIGKLNKNSLQKWLKSDVKINDYIEKMDDISLPKEDYVKFCVKMDDYYPIDESDTCLASISLLPQPLSKKMELIRCDRGPICKDQLLKLPTIAYALSHRLLYLGLLRLTRRCYVFSEEDDREHLDIMCANMYRETVYLARRGYFFRDLFMEHIALCGLLGYEEFFRRNWFQRTAKWIDEDGCMPENHNFEINRTRVLTQDLTDDRERRRLRKRRDVNIKVECQYHQMGLALTVLAHAIRHTLHYL